MAVFIVAFAVIAVVLVLPFSLRQGVSLGHVYGAPLVIPLAAITHDRIVSLGASRFCCGQFR